MGAACVTVKRIPPSEQIVIGYAYENPTTSIPTFADQEICEGNNYLFNVSSGDCPGNGYPRGYCSSTPNTPFLVPLYQVLIAPPDGSSGYQIQDVEKNIVDALGEWTPPESLCYIIKADETSRNLYCTTVDGAFNPMFLMSFGGLLTTELMYILYPFLLLTWIVMFVFIIKRCIKTLCCKQKLYKRIPKIDLDDDIQDCEKEDNKH